MGKISKSRGGGPMAPLEMIERYSADAVRYWAASARLGYDAAIDEQEIKVGRRLAIKVLNASKFVLGFEAPEGEVTEPVDLAMLATLRGVLHEATAAFEDYEHARALDLIERFFWGFTDDYLELVKQRAYAGEDASAVAALRLALDVLLRAFAPFLPYVTEEVWSWWREGSIHRSAWPDPAELAVADEANPEVYEVGADVLSAVRKEKALAKVSLKVPVEVVVVHDTPGRLAMLASVERDLREAGGIRELRTVEAEAFSVEVEIAPPDAA
jgi:valyl-tRNA synthetase